MTSHVKRMVVCERVVRFVEWMQVFVVSQLQLGLVGLGLGLDLG